MDNPRLDLSSRILAGFAANPAVFAHNPQCGWSLVNASNEQLCSYSLDLADILIEAERATRKQEQNAPLERWVEKHGVFPPKHP